MTVSPLFYSKDEKKSIADKKKDTGLANPAS